MSHLQPRLLRSQDVLEPCAAEGPGDKRADVGEREEGGGGGAGEEASTSGIEGEGRGGEGGVLGNHGQPAPSLLDQDPAGDLQLPLREYEAAGLQRGHRNASPDLLQVELPMEAACQQSHHLL